MKEGVRYTGIASEEELKNSFGIPSAARMKQGPVAVIEGVRHLKGTTVCASDLRAGAALMVAGLGAEGKTVVTNGQYICRGYAGLEKKLAALGGRVRLMESR